MRFRNILDKPISFDLDGKLYEIAPGSECYIPDHKAYVPKRIGLPLEPIDVDTNEGVVPAAKKPQQPPQEIDVPDATDDDLLEELTAPDPPKGKGRKG